MPQYCSVCQTLYPDDISEAQHREWYHKSNFHNPSPGYLRGTKRPHSPGMGPPVNENQAYIRPASADSVLSGFQELEAMSFPATPHSAAGRPLSAAPASSPQTEDDWSRYRLSEPSSIPIDQWNVRHISPVPGLYPQAILEVSQRLRSIGDWDGQHGDIAPWLLVRLPGWPSDLDLVIATGIRAPDIVRPPGYRGIRRQLRLRLSGNHYDLQLPDGQIILAPMDGDCFYHAVMRGLAYTGAILPGVSPGVSPENQAGQLRTLLANCALLNAGELSSMLVQRPVSPSRPPTPTTAQGNGGFAVPTVPRRGNACQFCGHVFAAHLKRHERICSQGPKDRPAEFPCLFCRKPTRSATARKEHERICRKQPDGLEAKFSCQYCGLLAANAAKLKQHARICKKPRPVPLSVEPVTAQGNGNFAVADIPGRGTACQFCGGSYASHLKEHERICIKRPPGLMAEFPCRYCGVAMSFAGTLKRHENTCIKRPPGLKAEFPCRYCSVAMGCASTLERHENTCIKRPPGLETKFPCLFCRTPTRSLTAQREHERTCDKQPPGLETKFPCLFCRKSTASVADQRRHENICKKRPPGLEANFPCRNCGVPAGDAANLKRHEKACRKRPADVRPADVRPADVRPADVRPANVRPADVRPGYPCDKDGCNKKYDKPEHLARHKALRHEKK